MTFCCAKVTGSNTMSRNCRLMSM